MIAFVLLILLSWFAKYSKSRLCTFYLVCRTKNQSEEIQESTFFHVCQLPPHEVCTGGSKASTFQGLLQKSVGLQPAAQLSIFISRNWSLKSRAKTSFWCHWRKNYSRPNDVIIIKAGGSILKWDTIYQPPKPS